MKPQTCVVCGTVYTPKSWNPEMVPMCSPACKKQRMDAKRLRASAPCTTCGTVVEMVGYKRIRFNQTGRAFCSQECTKEFTRKVSSETMAKTNRRDASVRMFFNNPMERADVRAKVSTSLRAMGWKPQIHQGNGHVTVPQQLLACALGWPMEVAILTEQPRGSGYPPAYKVDIGNIALKVAIEVDGGSHGTKARKEEDRKKDTLLASLGWRVLRFSNKRVTERLAECVQTVLSTISASPTPTPTSLMDW